jgi:predicted nucleic acid-binding Zn ribbon protein
MNAKLFQQREVFSLEISMTDKVAQHTHCQICGKAIPMSETLCSDECKQKYQSMIKKRKMLMYIMYALIFVILIMFVLSAQ